ncbi:chemotaxis protein methyltransferase CheR [Candidatus Gastranaerophilus sp. (ex Termes propinquus)]|nr:chemotaxis protein methyltransferase CheR [Candidatus Gastranaerophilus sp. (ex Termes propinquus)]
MTNNTVHIPEKFLDMFCEYVFRNFGIYVEDTKRKIFEMKLMQLMRNENITEASQYYHMIAAPPISENHKRVKNTFIDTVTVHKTNFFRENNHFEFIKQNIKEIIEASPSAKLTGELRIWSAACSTGEEPYTLSMLMKEILPPHMRAKILATDISPASVKKALEGVYKFGPEDHIPPTYIAKYFTKNADGWWISDEIKRYVTFRLFNLMDVFNFKTPFDIIFCRNVMIYFNRDVQEQLVGKFYDNLSNNGLLFIGHSESLIQLKHGFKYTEPTIYKKQRDE